MSHYTKERLDEMDDYQSIMDERLTKEEQAEIALEVELELALQKLPGLQTIKRLLDEEDEKKLKMVKLMINMLQKEEGEDVIAVLLRHGFQQHCKEEELIAFAKKIESIEV